MGRLGNRETIRNDGENGRRGDRETMKNDEEEMER
jgi:hypothetical protein